MKLILYGVLEFPLNLKTLGGSKKKTKQNKMKQLKSKSDIIAHNHQQGDQSKMCSNIIRIILKLSRTKCLVNKQYGKN